MKKFMSTRPLFCMCFSAVVSAFVCSYLDSSGIFVYCCVLICCALLTLPVRFEMKKIVLMIIVSSVVMSVSFLIYYRYNYESLFPYNGKTLETSCTAISKSVSTSGNGNSVNVTCRVLSGKYSGKSFKTRVYYDNDIKFIPSQTFEATLVFSGEKSNDKFDGDGIHISATADDINVISPFDKGSFLYNCYILREFVSGRIRCSTAEATAFLNGMILGDKSSIAKTFCTEFTEIGMSHVMAVSGMHLIFAVLFSDFVLLVLNIDYGKRCVFAFISVAVFTVLSGFSVSCIRAAIMICVLYAGKLSDRFPDSLTSLSLAAFIILIVSPYNVRCASFLLSSCAAFGVIVLTPMLNSFVKFKCKSYYINAALRFITGALNMSLAANIACLPVFVLMFKKVNLLAPISNIVLIIPIQVMFYLGFLSILLSFCPFISGILGSLIGWLYKFVSSVTNFEYNLRFTSVCAGYNGFYLIFALFCVLIVGIYIYYQLFPEQKIYPYVVSYAVLCIVLFFAAFIPNINTVKVQFADVGQGSCTVFSRNEKAVIVDCGGSDFDGLRESLRNSSVKRIEILALTHADNDHIGYLGYLINYYHIDKIIYPEFCDTENIAGQLELAEKSGIEVCALSCDTMYSVLGGASLQVFVERAYAVKMSNNTSALYKFDYAQSSVVCTGDMNIYQDYAYLSYGDRLDCDILLVAHHGSEMSSLPEILNVYSPDYSVISVGENDHGLPDEEAVSRLEKVSCVLRTDELSTIIFKINRKGYKLVNKT